MKGDRDLATRNWRLSTPIPKLAADARTFQAESSVAKGEDVPAVSWHIVYVTTRARPSSRPRVIRKQRPHEAPLVAHDASALIADPVSLDELWVLSEEPTVLLIRGEGGEAK